MASVDEIIVNKKKIIPKNFGHIGHVYGSKMVYKVSFNVIRKEEVNNE